MLCSKHKREQEQQRVAVGPGNAQCMYIRQVSLRRGACGQVWPVAAATAALLLLL